MTTRKQDRTRPPAEKAAINDGAATRSVRQAPTARKAASAKVSSTSSRKRAAPEVAEPSLQDELRSLKVERILQAAGKLFVERGFVGTTMDAIAEQLQMTKPFIYQFFDNKHAVLAAICDRELRESLALLNDPATNSGAPEDRLIAFIRTAMRRNIANRGLWTLVASEEKQLPKDMLTSIRGLEMQFHKRLSTIIEDGAASGAFQTDQPAMASRAVMGMTQWVRRWYRAGIDPAAELVTQEFAVLALRMLGCTREVSLPA
ncbi:MAG: TetR/AcrR family transcriptional regulator [Ottowia sp.]|uniref:TetR/AcrR family transcriptional regulator n=1 Tax=Ottowia sp. TaxID=1898956 RepID=UPI003C733A6E